MILAMMITVMCLVLSVGLTSIVVWQVTQNASESDARRASWAVDSAINAASEQMGAQGISLTNLPTSEPVTWSQGPTSDVAYKWWVGTSQNAQATTSNLSASNQWKGLGYGAGKWVALTSNSSQLVQTSTDGTSWATPTITGMQNVTYQPKVVYGLGKFIALPASSQTYISTSSDGLTWSSVTMPTAGIYKAACSPTACVFVNTSGTASYSSTNLTSFTTGGSVPSGTRAVAYGSNKFLAVGTAVASSKDAVSWATATTPSGSPWGGAAWVGDTTWVVYSATANTNTIITSSDATSWTAVTLPERGSWVGIEATGGKAALVATEGTDSEAGDYQVPTSMYLVSNDGKNWGKMNLPNAGKWIGVAGNGTSWLVYQAGTGSSGPSSYLVPATVALVDDTSRSTIVVRVQAGRSTNSTEQYLAGVAFAWDNDLKRWVPDEYYGFFDADNYVLPAQPTNLLAALVPNGTGGYKVALSWKASTNTSVTYRLAKAGSSTPLLNNSTATAYDDNASISLGNTYTYYLYAVNWAGLSSPAVVVAVPPPAQPSAPSLSNPQGTKNISATWTTVATATSYTLYRCPTAGVDCHTLVNGSYIGANGVAVYTGSGTSYTDTANSYGSKPYYYLIASNAGGTSTASATVGYQLPAS